MGTIVITEETLKRARDYVPFAEKKMFLDACAGRCFDKLQISAEGDAGIVAMPPMYKKNPFLVRRYMYAALVMMYLKLPYAPENRKKDEWLISVSDYDELSASHIFNQLERLKPKVSDPGLKNKIFDLLADYRDLEKMMNDELYSMVRVMNEPVTRLLASIQQTATPETLRDAGEKLKAAQAEIEKYAEERKADADGGNG